MPHEDYWRLKRAPFENVPDPRFYFPSPRHEGGLHRLLYGIEARKGAIMLTGEIGCGKTLLSRTLIQHLSHERYTWRWSPIPALKYLSSLKKSSTSWASIRAEPSWTWSMP